MLLRIIPMMSFLAVVFTALFLSQSAHAGLDAQIAAALASRNNKPAAIAPQNVEVDGGDLLIQAAASGGVKTVTYYLEEKGIPVDFVSKDGKTALCVATKKGHFGVVTKLLEFKADVELTHRPGECELPPISYALYSDVSAASRSMFDSYVEGEIFKLLKDKGARFEWLDENNEVQSCLTSIVDFAKSLEDEAETQTDQAERHQTALIKFLNGFLEKNLHKFTSSTLEMVADRAEEYQLIDVKGTIEAYIPKALAAELQRFAFHPKPPQKPRVVYMTELILNKPSPIESVPTIQLPPPAEMKSAPFIRPATRVYRSLLGKPYLERLDTDNFD